MAPILGSLCGAENSPTWGVLADNAKLLAGLFGEEYTVNPLGYVAQLLGNDGLAMAGCALYVN